MTPTQTELGAKQRWTNMEGAFKINDSADVAGQKYRTYGDDLLYHRGHPSRGGGNSKNSRCRTGWRINFQYNNLTMRILRNYILKECLQPFTLSISVLTSVFLLGYLPQLANKVINNGVSLTAMSQVFLYYIPILLGYTLPIACLVTVILALGHMSSENEILAMRASGIHLLRLLIPLNSRRHRLMPGGVYSQRPYHSRSL